MLSAEPSPPVRPKRRWFQFSLRTLLILTAICAVLFAWWSYKARQQRSAVKAIVAAGGRVSYDWEARSFSKRPPVWQEWLVPVLDLDYLANVQDVALDESVKEPDAALAHLNKLTALEGLDLTNSNVTDASLEQLKGLNTLQVLVLDGTQITDAGLEHLKGLTALKRLDLDGTKVTDAGVERLQKALPNYRIVR